MSRKFNVGTFNLYNLVSPNVKYYSSKKYNDEDYALKTSWIGAQLRRMDADVVGFQEVFQERGIQEAISASTIYEGATLVADERFDANGSPLPSCGLISRFPVTDASFITQFPDHAIVNYGDLGIPITDFSRPVLRAKIALNDTLEVYVIVAHLKSKRPMILDDEDGSDPVIKAKGKARSLIRRAAEAVALRAVLVDLMQDTQMPVILVGDMNDGVTAVTSDIMAGSPPWRYLPFERKEKVWDVLLYNVKDIQAKRSYHDMYFTHIYNGHYEALDHIYISEEFVYENRNGRIGSCRNVRVYNDHLVDETLSGDGVEKWQSDHAQVVAEIRLDERE